MHTYSACYGHSASGSGVPPSVFPGESTQEPDLPCSEEHTEDSHCQVRPKQEMRIIGRF